MEDNDFTKEEIEDLCRRARKDKDKEAMAELGWLYLREKVYAVSAQEACDWLRQSAKIDTLDYKATCSLGTHLLYHADDDAERAKGFATLKKAADNGNRDAIIFVILCLISGFGAEQNMNAAYKWCRRYNCFIGRPDSTRHVIDWLEAFICPIVEGESVRRRAAASEKRREERLAKRSQAADAAADADNA